MPTSRLDFLKALAKRGQACCISVASRKADGMDANQIGAKSAYRANSKKVKRYSVERPCSCTLEGIVLGLDDGYVGSTYEANKTQHGNRIDLEITQPTRLLVQALIFNTRGMIFSGVLDLIDVVRHLPGRDTSLRRMYASHGVPMEASTDGRRKKVAITIAQCQWAKRVRRSNNSSNVIDVKGLGNKDRLAVLERYLLPTDTCKR